MAGYIQSIPDETAGTISVTATEIEKKTHTVWRNHDVNWQVEPKRRGRIGGWLSIRQAYHRPMEE